MKCICCRKELESAIPGVLGDPFQPWGGGEVQFIFAYGSTKFDNHIHATIYRGVICDDCAEERIELLEEQK